MNYNELYSKANLEIDKGHYDKAIELLDRAISINYQADSLYTLKSFCLYSIGKFSKAKEQADRALVYNPRSEYAYYLLGISSREINVFDKVNLSIDEYREDIIEGVKFTRYKVWKGSATESTKVFDMKVVLIYLNKAIELNKNEPSNYYERGKTFSELAIYDKELYSIALRDFNKAIQLDSSFADFFFERALLYKNFEKTQLSLNDFNKAIALVPKPYYYANRGYLKREQLYDEKGACKDFKKAESLGMAMDEEKCP